MNQTTQNRTFSRGGFTLVELLLSITILSVILLAVATIVTTVAKIWTTGIGLTDNLTNARLVTGLLDRDVQMMVLRRDVPAFVDSNGNSACAFYTNVQGNPATDTRAVSLVQYLLNPATTTTAPVIWRQNYGMNYVTSTGVTPVVGTTTALTIPPNATLQTDNVNGIIRFKFQFIDGTGAILTPPYTLTSTPPSTSSPPAGAIPPATTPFWFDFTVPQASYNPRVVVISMVTLSNAAYFLATQSGSMSNLVGCFSTTAPTNQTYAQVWNSFLNSPNATFLSLPEPVRRGVKVFERHIPLPITPVN